jgi:hypothetical protein
LFETLKAAVEVIPNPLECSVSEEPIRQLILFSAVRFVFTLVAAISDSTANAFRSFLPDCCNGAHPVPQTGSLRKICRTRSTHPNRPTQIRHRLHFSEVLGHRNSIGRGMPSADAVAPGSVGGSTAET